MDINEPNKFAAPFTEMAERITRNDPKEFAGAMLMVAPDGKQIAVMITDPSQDLEGFLAHCMSKLQAHTAELQINKQGAGGSWPRR